MAASFDKPVVCPMLIGRTADLEALHLRTDQAKEGKGQTILLSGEAGVGKSRLVAEAKAYGLSQGFLLLQGNCFQPDRSCPYAPLLDLLRAYLTGSGPGTLTSEENAALARNLFPLLPELVPPSAAPAVTPVDPEHEKRRLFSVLSHFFISQAARHPMMLIIEDAHWSDDVSLEFLHSLARQITTKPLLVLLTYRSDEASPALRHWLVQLDREHLSQEFSLPRLTRSDIDLMLRAIFQMQRPIRATFLDAFYALTEGNPFFVEEVLKSLMATGEMWGEDGLQDHKQFRDLPISRSIQDAVQQRSRLISMEATTVLSVASAAGRRFDFALLQQVTGYGEAELVHLIKELIAAQFVAEVSAERFAFRHALTQQAIYAQLLARERTRLHQQIAETIEYLYSSNLNAHVADLAYHFYQAGNWTKALDYTKQAGAKAQSLNAPQAAIEQFSRAIEVSYLLTLTPAPELYRERGQAYEILGHFEAARADHETALQLAQAAGDQQQAWQALIDLGLLWAGRDYAKTGDYYQRAFQLARTMEDLRVLAHSLNRLGNWQLNTEHPLEALRHHEEALAIFQQVNDRAGVADTFDLLGMASYLSGNLAQGTAYYERAVALYRELENRQGLSSSLATLALSSATYQTETMVPAATTLAEAARDGEVALKLAQEIGWRAGEAYALICLGFCLGPQGEYTRAVEAVQKGLAIAQGIEHRQWITAANCALGALSLDLFALPTAQAYLEQAFAGAQEIGSTHWMRCATGYRASVAIAQQELALAETLLQAALDAATPMQTLGQRLCWAARAELALARGEPHLALNIIERLIASSEQTAERPIIPRLWKLRGQALMALRQPAEAETTLLAARQGAQAHGARAILWRIEVILSKLYQSQGRQEEATRTLAATQNLIKELATNLSESTGRTVFLQHAMAHLPTLRAPTPRRVVQYAFGGLTPREREVAALIARGKSNRAIAEALVIGERTVETHVGNILSKLGCISRAQIAAWAVEKGLAKPEEHLR